MTKITLSEIREQLGYLDWTNAPSRYVRRDLVAMAVALARIERNEATEADLVVLLDTVAP